MDRGRQAGLENTSSYIRAGLALPPGQRAERSVRGQLVPVIHQLPVLIPRSGFQVQVGQLHLELAQLLPRGVDIATRGAPATNRRWGNFTALVRKPTPTGQHIRLE